MTKIKKIFSTLLPFLIVFTITFAITEIYFRLTVEQKNKFDQIMEPRLWSFWSTGFKSDPFLPPYHMYANSDTDNESRLKSIYEKNKNTPNSKWESYDFIIKPEFKEKSKYSIQFNNMGYRDNADRNPTKPENTFRIIALGAYQTFGHGVNNDQSYPAQLEKMLNEKYKGKPNIEVWNGGRHAGSAIIGLARVKHEVISFNPDLVILDYGLVDDLIIGDDTFLQYFMIPDNKLSDIVRIAEQNFAKIFGQSLVVMNISKKLVELSANENIDKFVKTMRQTIDLLAKNKIPMIVIKTTKIQMPDSVYKKFDLPEKKSKVFYLDKYFNDHPPSEKLIKDFARTENWSTEYENSKFLKYYSVVPNEYSLNPFQYNAEGLKVIANGFYELIEPQINDWIKTQHTVKNK